MLRLLFAVLFITVWPDDVLTGSLPPPEESYRILMLLPVSPQSHRNVFIPVAEALADRGHQVEVLSSLPPFSTTSRNIIQYNTGIGPNESDFNMFDLREDPSREFKFLQTVMEPIAKNLYILPLVKELYKRRKQYDLFIIDHMINEITYPFVYEMPFITIATPGVDQMQSAMFGNVLNPSYFSTMLKAVTPPFTLYKRIFNLMMHILLPIVYSHWLIVPTAQREVNALFPDLPPLLEIHRNQTLTLMNSHFSIEMALPLLPSQVEVGGMHCRPGKPLPTDIEKWIEGAGDEGIIYFSLGSIAQGTSMPSRYRDVFVKAFRKLKRRVLWKYEGELPGLSDNVMLRSWLPQQDILSDPRVNLFISHGGLLGTQEAFYHAKPIFVIPIFGDQPRNAQNIVSKGVGLSLDWDDLTPDLIVDTINVIVTNPSYMSNAEDISRAFRDQLQTPRDRAVYWTEYVIRNKGAPQLRSPAADLSWIQYLCLDLIFILICIVVIFYYLLRRICRVIYTFIFGSSDSKLKNE